LEKVGLFHTYASEGEEGGEGEEFTKEEGRGKKEGELTF
jgi:hypothetical protein